MCHWGLCVPLVMVSILTSELSSHSPLQTKAHSIFLSFIFKSLGVGAGRQRTHCLSCPLSAGQRAVLPSCRLRADFRCFHRSAGLPLPLSAHPSPSSFLPFLPSSFPLNKTSCYPTSVNPSVISCSTALKVWGTVSENLGMPPAAAFTRPGHMPIMLACSGSYSAG